MPSLPRGNYKRTRKHRILVYLCALIKKVVLMLTYIIIEIESYINSKITRNPIIYIVKNILASYTIWKTNVGTILKNTTSVLTIYVFCLYIVMYAIDVSVTFISIFSDRGTFDISFFANVFHVLHTRCGCRIIVLPRESFFDSWKIKRVTNNKWKWSICFSLFCSFGRLTMYKRAAQTHLKLLLFNSFNQKEKRY